MEGKFCFGAKEKHKVGVKWLPPQLVEKPLLKATGLHFAGGVRGGGSPFVWNQMPAKSLRQQAFAPRSG
ncbi:hypothetical protein, partial [Dysosmobacter sp.]|uniref:hypothetical protein n=1 Tax=Dysosmobacter sp. TaxID=2591382 RepID=UPI002A8B7F41